MSADEVQVDPEAVWHLTVGTGPSESIVARMDGTLPATIKVNETTGEFTVSLPLKGCITFRPDGMSVEDAAIGVIAALFVNAAGAEGDDEGDDGGDA